MPPRSYAERHRFGRVARIPTPTPLGVGDVDSYLILPPRDGEGGVTLVDTGVKTPESFEALRSGLKEHGVAIEDVERILVTHAHMDHFGQAKGIRDLSGARVYASARLFPKVYESQMFLVMSEGVGHLDVLVDEGAVVLEERDGREIARAA
jgi:glyoxylase-like metal-dependent hydrolase (beta-lactamase superfamily II)